VADKKMKPQITRITQIILPQRRQGTKKIVVGSLKRRTAENF
jgi:hypothetical protein